MVTPTTEAAKTTTFRPRSDEEARRIEDTVELRQLEADIDEHLEEIMRMLSQTKKHVVQSRTEIIKPKGNERRNKTRKEKMQNQAVQALVNSTLERISNSYEMIFGMNRGLIHILQLIDSAPGGKISTRELLRTMNSMNMHKYLKQAERLGYVRRESQKMPPGRKGGNMIVNSLTEQGRYVLALSDEYLEKGRQRQNR
jgi:hypothetical protein